jgi:hypothetical protein
MGWSCSSDAARTVERWTALCVLSTGSSNTWEHKGRTFFFENSGREHADGAITGTVWRNVGSDRCVRVSSFRIEGDGAMTRGPAEIRARLAEPEPYVNTVDALARAGDARYALQTPTQRHADA